MVRRVGAVLVSGMLLSSIITVAVPNSALAYTYKGNCNSLGTTTTWDDLADSRSNVSGVEMDQYAIPGSSSWVTCTYAGSSGDTTAHWHVGAYSWFGGETADQNDTMGARPEATTFRTYALRVHDLTSGWQAYANDTFIIDNCTQGGTNRYIVNCNVQDTNGYGGFFLWNQ